jgi:hypothetical protein
MEKVKARTDVRTGAGLMNMSAKGWACALLLTLAVISMGMPTGTAPPGLPTLSVEVENPGEVETDPVEYKHVHTTATVTIENFLLGTTVNVNATTDVFWLVTVSPTTITVAQGETSKTEQVNIDLRVPPKASADRAVNLLVYVNASSITGIPYEAEDTANITVEQYYGLQVTANGTTTVEQGKNNTHRMHVRNSGNGKDNLTIALTNEAEITAKGLELEFDEVVNEVGADRTTSTIVRIRAEDDAEVGTVDAMFKVTSQGDASKSVNYRLTITIRKATSTNGGNGDGTTDGEEEGGISLAVISLVVVVALILIGLFVASRRLAEEDEYEEGEDED